MKDLASHGLLVRGNTSTDSNERRLELRVAATDAFVGWSQSTTRMSAGDEIVSINAQLVHRSELTDEQFTAAKEWLRSQLLSVY